MLFAATAAAAFASEYVVATDAATHSNWQRHHGCYSFAAANDIPESILKYQL